MPFTGSEFLPTRNTTMLMGGNTDGASVLPPMRSTPPTTTTTNPTPLLRDLAATETVYNSSNQRGVMSNGTTASYGCYGAPLRSSALQNPDPRTLRPSTPNSMMYSHLSPAIANNINSPQPYAPLPIVPMAAFSTGHHPATMSAIMPAVTTSHVVMPQQLSNRRAVDNHQTTIISNGLGTGGSGGHCLQSMLGDRSTLIRCPHCSQMQKTYIVRQVGSANILASLLACLCLPCSWLGCQCIPLFVDDWKDAVHYCSCCGKKIGRYNAMEHKR